MKSKKDIHITVLSLLLIVMAVASSLLLEEELADRVISIITTSTAIVGAAALFYQFKRDKNLDEARFLVEYSQQFYSTYDCADLMNELEKCRIDRSYALDVDKYYKSIVGYLEWLETLAALVNSGLLQIDKIDNVMSYRFFLIVNNKQVQDRELIVNYEFYRSIYELYPKWVKYKKENERIIVFEENDLSRTDVFYELLSKRRK